MLLSRMRFVFYIVLRPWAVVDVVGNHTGMDENGHFRGPVCSY